MTEPNSGVTVKAVSRNIVANSKTAEGQMGRSTGSFTRWEKGKRERKNEVSADQARECFKFNLTLKKKQRPVGFGRYIIKPFPQRYTASLNIMYMRIIATAFCKYTTKKKKKEALIKTQLS